MENKIIRQRLEALRSSMADKKIQYYMIPTSDFHNSEYVDAYFKVRAFFSNFTGSNGTLLVGEKEAGLWTDGRYFIQAQQELSGTGITLFRMMEEGVPTIAEYLEQNLKRHDTLGFDGRVLSASFGKELEKKLAHKEIRFAYEQDLAEGIWKDRPPMSCHPVTVLPESLCGQTIGQKVKMVRQKMEEKGTTGFLLSKLDDIMWLFNIRGKDVACNPVALSYAFVTMEEIYFFVGKNGITPELEIYAAENGIILKDYDQIVSFLNDLSHSHKGKILFDDRCVNFLLYKTLSKGTELISGNNPTEELKAVKNQVELQNMEEVYLQDSVAVTKFIYWLKTNIGKTEITELSASNYLDCLRAGIPGYLELSFPTISAYGANAAMMHYEATEEACAVLEPKGMLLVDSGGQYMGGTTDVTRTIVLGEISDEVKRQFTAVVSGMLQLTNARFLYGCTGRNLDILARQPLWNMGIDYKCGTGHGVGYMLNVHEGPQSIRFRPAKGMEEAVLEEGMTVTNEPGVYIEGSHGIRIENVMVVRKDIKNSDGQFMRFQTLTYVPIDCEAIDITLLSEENRRLFHAYQQKVYEKISPYLTEEEKRWLKTVTHFL